MKTCVFAGSFDPVTKGHENIIEKAKKLYDNVIVVVAINAFKTPLFPLDLRFEMLNELYGNDNKVTVEYWDSYIVDFMKEKGVTDYVRGVRNQKDIDYERLAEAFNKNRYPALNTVYLSPDKEFTDISSTLLKEKLLKGENVSGLIDEKIIRLAEKFVKGTAKK